MRLKGKTALITGASRGIGRSIAERFATEGADIAVNDIELCRQTNEVVEFVRGEGRRTMAIKADVANRKEVEEMFQRVLDELGPVHILVNNAGIETIIPFLEMTDDEWSRLTDVNLRGEWLCGQVFCRHLNGSGHNGSIINIGSIQAGKALAGRTHYAPAKLAIEALTRNMAVEMSPLGVRVNCIHPGLIQTDMTSWITEKPDLLKNLLLKIPMGRIGQPDEVAMVAAFLASDEASYLTGQSIYVDGGWVGV
jgi:NAD(P)-dependent dehydrogenase (short-subunit alcohol dehydrogenase family)